MSDNSADAMFDGVDHWTSLLSKIRHAVEGAEWHVQIDEHDLVWDEELLEYDY